MIDEVGELFGQSGDAAQVRVTPILLTLAAGLTLIGLGMLLTVVPGVLALLAARAGVDKEQDRLRNGFLPADAARTVRALSVVSTLALAVGVVAMGFQLWMVWTGRFTMWINTLLYLTGILQVTPAP